MSTSNSEYISLDARYELTIFRFSHGKTKQSQRTPDRRENNNRGETEVIVFPRSGVLWLCFVFTRDKSMIVLHNYTFDHELRSLFSPVIGVTLVVFMC